MAQNDFIIADQSASAALSDINSALQSLASCSSGATQPSVRYANQLWYDTTTHILKVRNEANSAWISILYVHQADNEVHILDNTYISDTSGNHVGVLGDQATSEWTTGTGTTESLVSPAKVKAAIEAATLNLSAGAVGSYAFARVAGTALWGQTYAGSDLRAAGGVANEFQDANTAFNSDAVTLDGTWRCMGDQTANNPGGDHPYSWTIFLRIA